MDKHKYCVCKFRYTGERNESLNLAAIAYNSIEFDSNNEVCVTGDTACEIYTIHGVKKFYHTFDNKLYKVMYKSGMNNYIFIYDGAMDEVRLK